MERLPRLLALSLTLSSRFEDDLSPTGVAEAFIKMESELIGEFGLWAGEVGNLVAMGMGDMLDSKNAGKRGRRSISGDTPEEEEDQEGKLGFADIVRSPRLPCIFLDLSLHPLSMSLSLTPNRSSCQFKEQHDTNFFFKVSIRSSLSPTTTPSHSTKQPAPNDPVPGHYTGADDQK